MGASISVVIPSFNQGEFLQEAIESVKAQRWPEVELVVVDGGSTDGTRDVLKRHSGDLTWWCSETDRGQGHAVNKGLERCNGDLVAFIGADDLYLPGTFADAAVRYEANPDCGAVVGGFVRIDERSRVISEAIPALFPWRGPAELMTAEPGSWRLHQVATFFSRRALDEVGRCVDENLRYVLDRELLNRICRRFHVVTSPKVFAAFRHHLSSKSTSEILPFSRELAALHLRDAPPSEAPHLRRKRRSLARRQRASGYLKLASADGRGLRAALSLATVPLLCPRLVLTRAYGTRWLEAIGLASSVRKLLGRPPSTAFKPRPLPEVINEL